MKIQFGDAERTAQFREKFSVGQAVMLENIPDAFGGTLWVKVTVPEDHGFIIYICSDTPFTVSQQSHTAA